MDSPCYVSEYFPLGVSPLALPRVSLSDGAILVSIDLVADHIACDCVLEWIFNT